MKDSIQNSDKVTWPKVNPTLSARIRISSYGPARLQWRKMRRIKDMLTDLLKW